jgi:hypothetical protein
MERARLQKVYEVFAANGRFVSATPMVTGGIGEAFRVATDEGAEYVLRCIRPRFQIDVPAMVRTKEMVSGHIRNKLIQQNIHDITRKYVTHFHTNRDQPYYKDHEGCFWTLTLFVKGARTYEIAETPEIAHAMGTALGEFKQRTCDFDPRLLHESVPAFQHLSALQVRLGEAVGRAAISDECRDVVETLRAREEEMDALNRIVAEGQPPARVTHNAFEARSVLFDGNDRPLCVLDLYMVMPGTIHHDFGDAVRAVCRPGNAFDLARFEAFAAGFLQKAGRLLSRKERETLPVACELMPYTRALRALVGHLQCPDPALLQRAREELAFLDSVARERRRVRQCLDSL